jgi:DNA-directed RNA polymerase subunit RPC12/RpoP
MNRCPHCGEAPCLPLWRKLALGPAGSARCRVCGLRVGVDAANTKTP